MGVRKEEELEEGLYLQFYTAIKSWDGDNRRTGNRY